MASRLQDTGNLVTDMQSALNVTRKAELRVQKLHSAYETAQELWAAFEEQAKINYQTERRRHMADLERIERDALEAEAQQNVARDLVRKIAIREASGSSSPILVPQAEQQVAALFDGWAEEDGHTMDGVLQRALATQVPPTTPVRVPRVRPRTPVIGTTVSAVPPQAEPPAVHDPYIAASATPTTTPSGREAVIPTPVPSPSPGQIPKHPGQRDRDIARVATSEAPPRASIKDATKIKTAAPARHVTLEEKLASKRATLQQSQALRPFGCGPPPPGLSELANPPAATGLAHATIHRDDEDGIDDSMD